MKKPIGVSLLTKYISNSFREDPLLYNLLIEGEVINLRKSRYVYFDLKENEDLISCVYFDNNIEVSEGDKIIVEASITIYGPKSKYQLLIKKINQIGLGSNLLMIQQLKDKLDRKGYFKLENKKKIRELPLNIGLITSLDSAAIKDFFKILDDYKYIGKVYTFHSLVQGKLAEDSIVNALRQADKMNLDVIVLTRGGGSNEDLSIFNSEKIADSVYKASTPILSAVGHERDLTIVDLVSDLRASTPTKAAEIIGFNFKNLRDKIIEKRKLNRILILNNLNAYKNKLTLINTVILGHGPGIKIDRIKDKIRLLSLENKTKIKAKLDFYYRKTNEINLTNKKSNEVFLERNKVFIKDSQGNIVGLDKIQEKSTYIIESDNRSFKILILEEVYE